MIFYYHCKSKIICIHWKASIMPGNFVFFLCVGIFTFGFSPKSVSGFLHFPFSITHIPCPLTCLIFHREAVNYYSEILPHTHRKTRKHRRHKQTCVNTHEEGTVIQTQTGNTGVSVAEDACVQQSQGIVPDKRHTIARFS